MEKCQIGKDEYKEGPKRWRERKLHFLDSCLCVGLAPWPVTRTCCVRSSYIPSQISDWPLWCWLCSLALEASVFLEAPFRRDGEDGGWRPKAVLCAPLGHGQRLNFSLEQKLWKLPKFILYLLRRGLSRLKLSWSLEKIRLFYNWVVLMSDFFFFKTKQGN